MSKLFILVTCGPEHARRCATPFHIAIVGAVMEWEVDMFFTIDGPLLLKKGVAETVYPKAGGQPLIECLRDAIDLGVTLHACTPSMELHDLVPTDLIDGVELAGGPTMLAMVDQAKVSLSF
jgi:uncharacterized protein